MRKGPDGCLRLREAPALSRSIEPQIHDEITVWRPSSPAPPWQAMMPCHPLSCTLTSPRPKHLVAPLNKTLQPHAHSAHTRVSQYHRHTLCRPQITVRRCLGWQAQPAGKLATHHPVHATSFAGCVCLQKPTVSKAPRRAQHEQERHGQRWTAHAFRQPQPKAPWVRPAAPRHLSLE